MAVGLLNERPDEITLAPLAPAFLERKGGPEALVTALTGQKIPADTANCCVRALREAAVEQPRLVAAVTVAGGLRPAPRG